MPKVIKAHFLKFKLFIKMSQDSASLTDDSISLESHEFIWNSEEEVSSHSYILPTVIKRLEEVNAKKVLDLGCGNGSMTRALQSAGFEMTGIDPSVSGIENALKQGKGDFRCLSSGEELPSDLKGRFDAVVSTEVIEHLLLPRQLFARAREAVTGCGGRLIISTPYHSYLKNLAIALCGGFDKHWHPLRDYGHVKFFSLQTLKQLFEECGVPADQVDLVGRFPLLAKSMIVSGHIKPVPAHA